MSPSGTPRYERKFMEKPRCYGSGFCESSRQKCGHYRVHGYRFCIWHILEDHEAPYKQCDHVENLTNVRCQFSVYLKTRDPRFCQMHSTMKENFAGLKRKQPMKQSSALGEFSVVVMAASVAHHVDIMERGSLSDSAPGDFVSDKGLRFDCRPAKRLKKEHVVCLDPSNGGTHLAGDAGQDSSPSAFSAERKGSRKSSKFLESLPLSASPPFLMADSAGQDHAGVSVGGAVDIGPVELTRVGLCSVSRVARAVKWQQVDMERLDLSGSGCLSRDCGNDSSSKKRGSAQRGLSKFVGVRRRPWGTYGAEICTPEGRVWLGTFDTEALAASAYDDAARLIRGTGTSTNFGEGSEDVELPLAWPQSDMQEEQDVSAEQGSAVKPAAPAASAMAVEPVPGSAGERMLESHPETSTETEMDTEMDTQGRGLRTPTLGISRTHHQSLLKPPHQLAVVNTARSTGRQSKPIDCSSVEKYVQESRSLGVRRINTGRYEASVYNKLTKKMIYVGRFDTREEAVTARDRVIANVIVDSNKHKGSSPGTAAHQKPDEAPGQSGAKSRTHTGKGGLSNQKLVSEPETGPARRRHRKKVPSAAAGFSLGDPGLLRTPILGQVPRDLKTSHGSADRSLGVQAAGGRSASDSGRANALAVPKTSGGDHKLFGVTKKWSTGRYEASFYDRNEKRKVYVGMFETDLEAACARDQLAVQCGATSHLNFPEWAASAQKDKGPIPLASRESPKPVAGLKANKGSGARDRAVKIAHWLKRKSGHVDLNSVPGGGSGDSIPYAVPAQEIAQDDHSIPFALPPEEASQYDRSVPYADPPQQISQSDHSNFSDDYTASEEADSEDFASDASDSGYENARLKRFSKSADRSRLKRKRGSMLHHDNSLSSSGDELLSEDGQEFNQQHPQGEHTPGDDFRRRRTSSGLSTDTVDEYMFQDLKSEYGRIYKTTSKRRAMLGQSRLNHGPKDDAGNSVRSPAGESDEQAEGIGSRPQIDSCTGLEKRLQGTSSIKNQRQLGTGPDSGKDGAGRLDLKRAPRRCPYIGVQATAGGRFKSKMYLAATKQHIYVGTFDSAVEAAEAYDDMVFKRSGNIKRLNFPERYGLNLPAAKKQRVKTRKKVVVGQASDDRQWRPSSASNVKSLAQQSGKLPEEEEGKAYSGSKLSQKFEVQNDEAYDEDHEVKTRSISADDSPFVVKMKPLVESADLPVADDEKKRRQRKPGKTLHRHYKGVYSNGMKFKCIYYNPLAKRHTYLGSFVTAEEAARVYDQLWFWQFGESPNLKLSPEELLPRSASCYHPLSGGTGEYYGVCETGGLYHAMFYNDRNHLPFYCGNFKSAIDAAHAYDKAAFKELGAAAVLNFPKNLEDRLPKTSTWSTAGGEQQSGAIEHNIEARFEAFEGGNGDSARRGKLAVRRDVTKLK